MRMSAAKAQPLLSAAAVRIGLIANLERNQTVFLLFL